MPVIERSVRRLGLGSSFGQVLVLAFNCRRSKIMRNGIVSPA
jgi:hypothetical protein